MKFIDTHAHIYYSEDYPVSQDALIRNSLSEGVDRVYMPNVSVATIEPMMALAKQYPGVCIPMMGLHPCDVYADYEQQLAIIEEWLEKEKFAAIGEAGIDLYHDVTFFEQQKEALKIQAGWALKYKLPLIIHCRNSFRETMEVLLPFKGKGLTGIFHCFGGALEEANEVIDLGFLLGIGGVVTYKKSGLDQVLPHIDLKHIVLETDSPYLSPVPFRGKPNTPANIPLIAEKIASILNVSLQKVATTTTANALALFNDSL